MGVQFRVDITCLPKQKHMVEKGGKADKVP
jgi:hypothetical protein